MVLNADRDILTLVDQELHTPPEYLSSPLVFSGVPVTRSLVLCVCFVDRWFSFCTFSFGHCVVCPSNTDSDYPFGIFKLFLFFCPFSFGHCIVCPSNTDSDYPFGIFKNFS